MSRVQPTGRNTPGLARILAAPGGPKYRQLEYWVQLGHLRPERVRSDGRRELWRWPESEQEVAIRMARLAAAGLSLDVAEDVARASLRRKAAVSVGLGPGVRLIYDPRASA